MGFIFHCPVDVRHPHPWILKANGPERKEKKSVRSEKLGPGRPVSGKRTGSQKKFRKDLAWKPQKGPNCTSASHALMGSAQGVPEKITIARIMMGVIIPVHSAPPNVGGQGVSSSTRGLLSCRLSFSNSMASLGGSSELQK